jgi:hypothetical protein
MAPTLIGDKTAPRIGGVASPGSVAVEGQGSIRLVVSAATDTMPAVDLLAGTRQLQLENEEAISATPRAHMAEATNLEDARLTHSKQPS